MTRTSKKNFENVGVKDFRKTTCLNKQLDALIDFFDDDIAKGKKDFHSATCVENKSFVTIDEVLKINEEMTTTNFLLEDILEAKFSCDVNIRFSTKVEP